MIARLERLDEFSCVKHKQTPERGNGGEALNYDSIKLLNQHKHTNKEYCNNYIRLQNTDSHETDVKRYDAFK